LTPSAASPFDESSPRAAPLPAVLAITFLASVSGGTFWAGLFFVTAGRFGFSEEHNLVLAVVMGAIYALAARASGRLSRRIAPRALLFASLGAWTVAALLPVLIARPSAVWAAAILGSAASAVTFPLVESYLVSGRHGAGMRAAIGKFNVTWTPATAVPLLVLPWLVRVPHLSIFGLSALVSGAALLAVGSLTPRPAPHPAAPASAAIGPEYPWLLRTASWLLPLSYVISSTLAPVLPHRLAAVGVGAPASALAAVWMAARFAALFAMWRTNFWHGRWETLLIAASALIAGVALVLLSSTPLGLIAGLVLYGVGMGLIYYSTLYYAMAIGHGAVDAGGNFEALIGLGYVVGPSMGLLGQLFAGRVRAETMTVALTWLVMALAAPGALRPYFRARRAL
jgi:hypothetical protein